MPKIMPGRVKVDNTDLTGVTIDFPPLSMRQWQDFLTSAPFVSLTQSPAYGAAMAATTAFRPHLARVYQNGQVVAVAQFLVAQALSGMIRAVTLDRGPVWLENNPSVNTQRAFWAAIARLYPRSLLTRRRMMPDGTVATGLTIDDYTALGFRNHTGWQPYQTVVVDLSRDMEIIRANMDKKWRNLLNKSEREGLDVRIDQQAAAAKPLIKHAVIDQTSRGYRGADDQFLAALSRAATAMGDLWVITVERDGHDLAAGLFIRHGTTATWQTGWVSAAGRDSAANYLMLWTAMKTLKDKGVRALDLGGLNTQDALGIAHFKGGLKGRHVQDIGMFH